MRCLALAEALEATGDWQCRFATRMDTCAMVPLAGRLAVSPLELSGPDHGEADEIAAELSHICDLLVIDHYGLDETFELSCRSWANRVMVIDDLADRKHDCDFLLDQTLGRQSEDYLPMVPATCRFFVGIGFALLRPEFAAARHAAFVRRRQNRSVERILVTLGASDPLNVTSMALEGIGNSGVDAAVDVVMGRNAPHVSAVQRLIPTLPQEVTLHQAPTNIAELMSQSDVAIGAAGTTSWERCCLGLPTLTVLTADNQTFVAQQLEKAAAAQLLGAAKELTATRISEALTALLRDDEHRYMMSKRAFEICDGRGVERVILSLSAEPGEMPWLRMATSEDSSMMFEWQNHPETRRFARNPKAPTWDEHCDWMNKTLSDATVMLMIVMSGNEPVGVLRLDQIENSRTREISIYVSPERYGEGIARGALRSARSVFPGWTFVAEVLPENRGSHALFLTAGYRRSSDRQYISDPTETMN